MNDATIAHHASFQSALMFYNDSLLSFDRQPKEQETQNPKQFEIYSQAYFAAQRALVAVIDAYVAGEKIQC